ncbi:Concanavalin A-like lectin/glucanases superfamily protein [uncultured archaeon]|nr:Concanavalin A-like lectin/glucanases superfamily protein [uncultured archaeon]
MGQSKRGQTTVELLLLLGVSLTALLIVYSLYGQQIQYSTSAKEIATAKSTIERMVTAANSLSISGAGSRTIVLVELPTSLRMDDSGIYGNELVLKLRNRTDIVGMADVNFSGTWKRNGNSFVKGGYYATLVFDGNAVNIIYDDFDLSTESISIQTKQSTISQSSFTIRNNSSKTAYFTVASDFSNSPYAVISLGTGDNSFSLGEGEMRLIDINLETNSSAYGNYSGAIDIEAQLNDNYRDYNISKQVVVSAEVSTAPSGEVTWESLFFTTQNDFSANANISLSKYFKTTPNFGISFIPSGELDWNANANYTYLSSDYNRDMNGLVGYWKFNDKNSGGYILNSATGLRDGQLMGGADVNGVGLWDTNSGYFDGTNDYADLGNDSRLNLTGDFSIFAWVNYSSFATSNYWEHAIIARDVGGGSQNKWIFTVTSQTGGTHFEYYNTTTGTNTELNGNLWTVSLGAWNYLGITKQGSTFTFYRNGQSDGTAVSANALAASIATNTKVGFAESRYFNGTIDDASIWNRALSASEIAADYNNFLSVKYISSQKYMRPSHSLNSLIVGKDQNFSYGYELDSNDKFFDANLLALWHFNDKNSDGFVLNSATGLRDGNLAGGADVNAAGLWDTNAGYFDGVNDYLYTTFNPNSNIGDNNPFSVSFWAYPKNKLSNLVTVGCGNWNVSPVQRWFVGQYTGNWYWGLGNTYDTATGVSVDTNTWQHIVWVYDGSKNYIYKNGVLTYTKTYTGIGNYPDMVSPLGAINQNGGFVQDFNGLLDDVAIWNRALSSSDVSGLFRKGISRLDLNISSCSDSACATVVGTKQISGAKHGAEIDISSLALSDYLKYSVGFNFLSQFADNNYTPYKAAAGFPAFSDFNLSYTS